MAAYIPVPRDLTRVKSKILFNLTKRQLLCFGAAALIGVPSFFVFRKMGNISMATIGMILLMMPFLFRRNFELTPCCAVGKHHLPEFTEKIRLSAFLCAEISMEVLKMNKLEKIGADLTRAREKQAEWTQRAKELEERYREEENSMITGIVHSANLSPEQLAKIIALAKDGIVGTYPDAPDTNKEEKAHEEASEGEY